MMYPWNMVIFNSYVQVPEGKSPFLHTSKLSEKNTSFQATSPREAASSWKHQTFLSWEDGPKSGPSEKKFKKS